ncbi:MAG: PKD domain-containing protein [Bryobacteraceae bacterium]|nr:PKD domain-containing protein [Bryobacteraceae bacterium]
MRYVWMSAALAVTAIAPWIAAGQTPEPTFSITNYKLFNSERISRTQWSFTYSADVINRGPMAPGLKATLQTKVAHIVPVAGQDKLLFGDVPAASQKSSLNTFTILIDRSVAFEFKDLLWTFQSAAPEPPVANAGPNQTVSVGATVILNGAASTNPSGVGTLTYQWVITSKPPLSSAALTNANSVSPTFLCDAAGTYLVALTVSNGFASSTASVMVTTTNTPPVAHAGANQTVPVGAVVTLSGAQSSDVDGDSLTFQWSLTAKPPSSAAVLSGPTSISPTFVADRAGTYTARLVVNDGKVASTPSTVTITTENSAPVANAGPAQKVDVGALVQLNGAASTDVDGNPLTYSWSLPTRPAGSGAVISNAALVNPTFTADRPGTYIAQLMVNDGFLTSPASTVTITTNDPLPPVANAGPNQTVPRGATVLLSGSGTDPQNLPITFAWSLTAKPAGSAATLSSTSVAGPTFLADRAGTYVAQLIVNNGYLSSPPATVTITTANSAPVAVPGPDQNVAAGATVALNGGGSLDADNDPLTYLWSLLSKPPGSAAVLTSTTNAATGFVADLPGNYVAQLIVHDGFVSSAPATVMVAAGAKTLALSPNPFNLFNAPGSMTLTLSAPAKPGGQQVNLASSNANVASVPANVTVPQGSTGANFQVTPGASGTATITASATGFDPATAAVNVSTPTVAIQLQAASLGVGRTVDGTVTLPAPASAPGVVVLLSSNPAGIVGLPANVTIPGGQTSAPFTAEGLAEGTTTLRASAAGYASGTVNVAVVLLGIIRLPAGVTVGPGQSVPFPISLATGAPVGGVTVNLQSSDPAKATVTPASVFIAAGTTTPIQQPVLNGLAYGAVTISGSAAGFTGDSKQATVTASLTFDPPAATFPGNATQNLTLKLSAPAPGSGVTINLSSDNTTIATVPLTVAFGPSATTATVPVTTLAAGSTTIRASALPSLSETTAAVTVVFFGTINLPAALSTAVGQAAELTLSLPVPAPAGGTLVTLNSNDTTRVTVSPGSVLIPAGARNPSSNPTVTGVNVGSAIVRASAPGFLAGSTTVTVTGLGAIVLPANVSVGLGQSAAYPVTLPAPAPAGGVTVTLASTDTARLTISPTSVVVAAGATTPAAQPNITGVNLGTANITASASGYTSATQQVRVTAVIAFQPATLTITGATTQNLNLTLSAPAPAGGLVIALTSDSAAVATVPASVTFPAGSSSTAVPVTSIAPGATTIRASALPNVAETTASVTVLSAGAVIVPSGLSVGLGQTSPIAITLPVAAPAGGVTVTVSSSDTSRLTIAPLTFTIAGGATAPAIQPQITGVKLGAANLTASAPGYASTTQSVRVTATVAFQPNTLTIGGITTQNLPLQLSAAAPAGGVTVNLSSDNTNIVTVPATITFSAGQNQINVPVTAKAIGSTTIRASASPDIAEATASITVTSAGAIQLPVTTTVNLGQSLAFPIALPSPAPAGGVVVTLASSDAGRVAINPATVTIPAGSTTPPSQPQITGANLGAATLSASAPGYTPASREVRTIATIAFQPTSVTVVGTATQNLSLVLSANAPTGGVVINLSSENTATATVPSSVTVPAGLSAVNVPVTGVAPGATTIRAGAPPNIAEITAGVTVVSAGAIVLPVNAAVGLGQSVAYPVTLPAPAATAVTVNLSSSDATRVSIAPAQVQIAAGATAPATPPQITGHSLGTANITATASGYTTATQQARVTATLAFDPASITVSGTSSQNVTLRLSAPAPAGGVTVNLVSDGPTIAAVPATAVFAAGSDTAIVPVTGVALGSTVIRASAPPNVAEASASVTVVSAGLIGLPVGSTVALAQSAPFPITLPAPAPPGGVTVTLLSLDTTKVSVSSNTVLIPAGAVSPPVETQVFGVSLGAANIQASAPGYTTATQQVRVTATISLTPGTLTLPAASAQNLTITLAAPAPAGGVTINVTSDNTNAATVPATATIPAGGSTASVPVTAVAAGSTVVRASALPSIPEVTANITVTAAGAIQLPASATVPLGQSAPYPISISVPAPSGGLTVTLTSSDPARASITPGTVTIPAGATTPAAQPVLAGLALGGVNIIATAPGFTGATRPVQVVATLAFNPPSLTLVPGAAQSIVLTLSAPAPAGGVVVGLSSDSASVSVPISATFAAGATSVVVPVQAVSVGSATITAGALPNVAVATALVTVVPIGTIGSLAVGNYGIGRNLQASVVVMASQAAPAGGLRITLASSDPSKLVLAGRPGDAGGGSLSVTIPEGLTSIIVFAQALAGSGSALILASASNYTTGSGTVSLTPSAILLTGPGGIGVASFTTNPSVSTNLSVIAARLTAAMAYIETQAVRGGFSAQVDVTSGTPSVGSVSGSPATIAGGTDTANLTFLGATAGNTLLTASVPDGFSAPLSQQSVTAFVEPAALLLSQGSPGVGKDLQTDAQVVLTGVAPGGASINVTSNDPSKLLLSNTPTGAGLSTITVTIGAGFSRSPAFYLQALAANGTVTYTATSPGFGSATGTVTLSPSGIVMAGPFGLGVASFPTTTGAGPSNLTLYAAQLDASLNYVATQTLRGGMTVSVPVISSLPTVGTITVSPVSMAAGASSAGTQFQPSTAGSTTLSVGVPVGFSTPAGLRSVIATVSTPGMALTDGLTIGQDLQYHGTLVLGQAAPAGGLAVTLTSANPAALVLSASATVAGSGTLVINVPAGSNTASYYLQALAGAGSVNYTATAGGYASRTASITLGPSGVALAGPVGFGLPFFFVSLSGGLPVTLTVYTGLLDSASRTFVEAQPLRAGLSVNVPINNTIGTVGSVTPSPAVINAGFDSAVLTFTPLATGSTVVSLSRPSNFGLSANKTSLQGTVTP